MNSFTELCAQVGFVVLFVIAMGGIFHAVRVVEEWWDRRLGPQGRQARIDAWWERRKRALRRRGGVTLEDVTPSGKDDAC